MRIKFTWQLVASAAICLACIMMLLAGCTTAGKATRYFDAHPDTAAGYCAAKYPVIPDSSLEVKVDTAAYNHFVDNTIRWSDSVIEAARRRHEADKADLLAHIRELREKGEYSESVAEELAARINAMQPQDTAELRRSIEKQLRATLKPCADTVKRIREESTARLAQEQARARAALDTAAAAKAKAAYNQAEVDRFHTGQRNFATAMSWAGVALLHAWWFWALVAGFIAYLARGAWLPGIFKIFSRIK